MGKKMSFRDTDRELQDARSSAVRGRPLAPLGGSQRAPMGGHRNDFQRIIDDRTTTHSDMISRRQSRPTEWDDDRVSHQDIQITPMGPVECARDPSSDRAGVPVTIESSFRDTQRWPNYYDFAIPLDADRRFRNVATLELQHLIGRRANPEIGVYQNAVYLFEGDPARSTDPQSSKYAEIRYTEITSSGSYVHLMMIPYTVTLLASITVEANNYIKITTSAPHYFLENESCSIIDFRDSGGLPLHQLNGTYVTESVTTLTIRILATPDILSGIPLGVYNQVAFVYSAPQSNMRTMCSAVTRRINDETCDILGNPIQNKYSLTWDASGGFCELRRVRGVAQVSITQGGLWDRLGFVGGGNDVSEKHDTSWITSALGTGIPGAIQIRLPPTLTLESNYTSAFRFASRPWYFEETDGRSITYSLSIYPSSPQVVCTIAPGEYNTPQRFASYLESEMISAAGAPPSSLQITFDVTSETFTFQSSSSTLSLWQEPSCELLSRMGIPCINRFNVQSIRGEQINTPHANSNVSTQSPESSLGQPIGSLRYAYTLEKNESGYCSLSLEGLPNPIEITNMTIHTDGSTVLHTTFAHGMYPGCPIVLQYESPSGGIGTNPYLGTHLIVSVINTFQCTICTPFDATHAVNAGTPVAHFSQVPGRMTALFSPMYIANAFRVLGFQPESYTLLSNSFPLLNSPLTSYIFDGTVVYVRLIRGTAPENGQMLDIRSTHGVNGAVTVGQSLSGPDTYINPILGYCIFKKGSLILSQLAEPHIKSCYFFRGQSDLRNLHVRFETPDGFPYMFGGASVRASFWIHFASA
jgi:hypothetical protein